MNILTSTKQNIIYFLLVFITIIATILLYHITQTQWILFRKAEIKYHAKEYAAAIDLYKESLEAGLSPSRVNLKLAGAYVARGRFNEAIPFYRQYLLTNPNETNARLELAKALTWIGNFDEAEVEYKKILEINHENNKKN